MTRWLVIAIGLAYLYGSIEKFWMGDLKMSLLLISYSVASFALASMT
jgi:hypothetical protein